MGEACSKDVHNRQKTEKGMDVIGWKIQEIMPVCTCLEGTEPGLYARDFVHLVYDGHAHARTYM